MLLKKKKKEKKVGCKTKSKGWSVFVQCWLFVLTQSSNLQCLQFPTKHSTAPIQWWGVNRGGKACMSVCVQEEWPRDVENLWRGGKEDKASRFFFFYVCACFFLKSSKSKPQLKMYICQSWANSDIKCQRARWNTDEVPPRFPRLFLNRCCGLLLYYTSSAERHEKKKKE